MTTRVVHCRREPYDVYIGRAMPRFGLPTSKWHNPFTIGADGSRSEVITRYRQYVTSSPALMADVRELRGKTLGCWCAPRECHGHVLARLADQLPPA